MDESGNVIDTSSGGDGGIWSDLINNAGDILGGTASVLAATNGSKTPNATTVTGGGSTTVAAKPATASVFSNPLYVVLGVIIVIAVMYMLFKKK